MSSKGMKAREAVLWAAAELLEKSEDGVDIQIRDVARLAGVSLGIPNYYFGSKENLIREALWIGSSKVIERGFAIHGSLAIGAEEKVRLVSKDVGKYYAAHPKICRVRVNSTLFLSEDDPHRKRHRQGILLPLFKEIAPHKSEEYRKLVISMLADSFDLTFLRAMSGSYDIGFDYFDDESRDRYIDKLVDLALALLKS
jgi:AcrR family transcriptional regulator